MKNRCITQNMLVRLICNPNLHDKKVKHYISQVKLSDVLFFGPYLFPFSEITFCRIFNIFNAKWIDTPKVLKKKCKIIYMPMLLYTSSSYPSLG